MELEKLVEELLFAGNTIGKTAEIVMKKGYTNEEFQKALNEFTRKYISKNDEYVYRP